MGDDAVDERRELDVVDRVAHESAKLLGYLFRLCALHSARLTGPRADGK